MIRLPSMMPLQAGEMHSAYVDQGVRVVRVVSDASGSVNIPIDPS